MHLPSISTAQLDAWIQAIGYVGVSAIIFAETGLFFCFFFPGDSLLFTAGLLAARGIFKIEILILCIIVMAFLGYWLGYWIGKRMGSWLSRRKDTWFYKKKYLHHAQNFYHHYGKKALLMGRLLPVVRTFIPVVAGMVHMNHRTYMWYNFMGAVIWGVTVPLLGYFLGAILPKANHYLLLAIACIIVVSLVPSLIDWMKKRKKSQS